MKAEETMLHEPGWIESNSLGSVYVNEYGKVVHAVSADEQRTIYPYRARMVRVLDVGGYRWQQDGWDNCSGDYTPSYLARLIREGKAMWS